MVSVFKRDYCGLDRWLGMLLNGLDFCTVAKKCVIRPMEDNVTFQTQSYNLCFTEKTAKQKTWYWLIFLPCCDCVCFQSSSPVCVAASDHPYWWGSTDRVKKKFLFFLICQGKFSKLLIITLYWHLLFSNTILYNNHKWLRSAKLFIIDLFRNALAFHRAIVF